MVAIVPTIPTTTPAIAGPSRLVVSSAVASDVSTGETVVVERSVRTVTFGVGGEFTAV